VTEKAQRHGFSLQHHNKPPHGKARGLRQDKMAQVGEDSGGDPSHTIRLRSYQQEMLAKSLKRNVIVAMPTGSKKPSE